MNDEILKCDKKLLKAAKQANAIGGTTLLLSILDNGSFWVANVGDSRGVYSTETGQAVPLSFDHKPCQLKEKRRIQEAGGFVSLNGVWRVQGVLATSRALGDFPLKEKKVVVADPDILSFNINDHKMEFAGFSCLTFHGVGDKINGTNSYLARCLQTTEVRNLSIHFASSQFTERHRETLLLGISRPGSMSQDIVWCNGSQWLEVSHLPTFPPLSIPPSSILSWGYLWNIEVPKPNQDHLNPLFNIQMLFENLVSRSVGALSNWGPYPLYKIVSSMVFCWNPTLAKRFDKAKEMFVNQEERLSFHGTNRESAEKILEFGFNEKLVKRTYHGEAGVYTTDLFDKAFQFCKRHNGAVLICRVLLGSSHIRSEHTDMSGIKITADSVLVPRDNKVFSRQTLPTGAYFQAGLRSADQALPIGVLYINSFDEMK